VYLENENEYKAGAGPPVSLSLRVKPQWVGVFVNYEEGLASFYDVESSSHIYSYTAQSFTENLYPFFSPCTNDGGKNSSPLWRFGRNPCQLFTFSNGRKSMRKFNIKES